MPGWECVFESVRVRVCVCTQVTAAISWRLQNSCLDPNLSRGASSNLDPGEDQYISKPTWL